MGMVKSLKVFQREPWPIVQSRMVTSMLVTDVGDKMCWCQLIVVGDSFGYFGHQHSQSFYISVGHQH